MVAATPWRDEWRSALCDVPDGPTASSATVPPMEAHQAAGELSVTEFEPLLGTVVEVRVRSTDGDPDDAVAETVAAEMRRLEQVFSVYRPDSSLCRWRAGHGEATWHTEPELVAVLGLAVRWFDRGRGRFHPCSGRLTALWRAAEREGVEPAPEVLAAAVAELRRLPFGVGTDGMVRTGDCSGVDLNALVKGWIVDRAVAVGMAQPDVLGITVNAGGDLCHRGVGSVVVGIEDPYRPYDNVRPLLRVVVHDGALATSGPARRGVRVAGRWYGHTVDPRTGRPVDRLVSASVLAPDAATADAVATIVGVGTPEEALEFVAGLDGVGCCVIDVDRQMWRDPVWQAAEC
jgi:thiamine biosynthesis lipoprotein